MRVAHTILNGFNVVPTRKADPNKILIYKCYIDKAEGIVRCGEFCAIKYMELL